MKELKSYICIFANGKPMVITGEANVEKKEELIKAWKNADILLNEKEFKKNCLETLGFSENEEKYLKLERGLLDEGNEKFKRVEHYIQKISNNLWLLGCENFNKNISRNLI